MPPRLLVGVDIGGTKTAIVASLDPPSVLERIEFPTRPARGPGPAIDLIKHGIRDLLSKHLVDGLEIAAIGVSCGNPLDPVRGVIQAPPNLSTWVDVPITAILEREFDVKCRLENDANAGAVAEHRFGAGRGCRHMVFITMGTGFGAGIIANGQLYQRLCRRDRPRSAHTLRTGRLSQGRLRRRLGERRRHGASRLARGGCCSTETRAHHPSDSVEEGESDHRP